MALRKRNACISEPYVGAYRLKIGEKYMYRPKSTIARRQMRADKCAPTIARRQLRAKNPVNCAHRQMRSKALNTVFKIVFSNECNSCLNL